ncbi:UDP-glucosyltransferase 2-like [Aphomia sociella]
MRILCLSVAAFLVLQNVDAARVLGLFPHSGRSHQMVFEPLLRRLAERGHHLTVASFFPLKNPPENYTDVSLEGITVVGIETIDLTWFESQKGFLKLTGLETVLRRLFEFVPLNEMALNVCSKLVSWLPLKDVLRNDYDVVLVENFNSDCMLGLLHVYGIKAPVIALSSTGMMPWSAERIGVTENPSYVPVLTSMITNPLTFLERLQNTFLTYYFKLWFRYTIQIKEQQIIEKHFGRKIVDLNDLAKNMTLMLVNTFHSLNGVLPLLPGLVNVGGMHLDESEKPISHVSRILL